MSKKKLKLECTVNFEVSLTSDEVELEVLDVEDENKFVQIGLKNKLGLSKVSVITSTDSLKKILEALES